MKLHFIPSQLALKALGGHDTVLGYLQRNGHAHTLLVAMEINLTIRVKSHKVLMSFDPVIPLLGLYPMEIIPQKKKVICMKVLISELFIMMKNWKL